jgi:uncharacterized protein (DUF433 family)
VPVFLGGEEREQLDHPRIRAELGHVGVEVAPLHLLLDRGLAFLPLRRYTAIMSNENLLSRITVDPGICHGKPCVRGLRYPVETILEYLAGGDTADDLLAEFPDLEREDILACHEYSRQLLAAKSVHLTLA